MDESAYPALGNTTAPRGRGTMLWFNAAKDLGALETEGGIRMEVPGTALASGERPTSRCSGRAVEFQYVRGAVSDLTFVPEANPRRARRRHRRPS